MSFPSCLRTILVAAIQGSPRRPGRHASSECSFTSDNFLDTHLPAPVCASLAPSESALGASVRAVDRCVAGRPTEALPQNREILAPSFGRLLSAVRQGTRAPVPPRPSCPRCAAGRPAGSDAPRTLPEVQVICRVSTRKQLTEFTQFVCLTPRRVLSSTSGLLLSVRPSVRLSVQN